MPVKPQISVVIEQDMRDWLERRVRYELTISDQVQAALEAYRKQQDAQEAAFGGLAHT